MIKKKFVLWLCGIAVAATTVTVSYAACYALYAEPQCVSVGSCYSQCTPQGCSESTCIVATQAGYEYGYSNVYPTPSQSGWQNRINTGLQNNCYVTGCKVWNRCTQQYEYSPINGCSCNTTVPKWNQASPSCQ